MRIISKWHDFYDVGMGMGFDPDILYIRKEEVVKDEIKHYERNIFYVDGQILTPYQIGFCGNWYKCIEWLDDYYYDYDKLAVAFDTLGYQLNNNGLSNRWNEVYSFLVNREQVKVEPKKPRIASKRIRRMETYKTKKRNDKYPRWYNYTRPTLFQCYRSPIIVTNRHQSHITINCNLNKYQFYKVMDPYTAYQKLYQWFGNQASPEKPIPPISNEDMIEAKGFDLKTSFRKEKKEKK